MCNITNLTSFTLNAASAIYVFAPVNYNIKVIIACAYAIVAAYALVANSLIFYFTQKNPSKKNALSRSFLVNHFIQSLALSDILASLSTVPILTSEMFVDFIKTDFACKVDRFICMYFHIVTIMNYLVIGIERYIGIFHPFCAPSVRAGKRLVAAAWVLAAVLVMVLQISYNLVQYELDNNMYTLKCNVDHSNKLSSSIYISFAVICWLVPCIILVFANTRIAMFYRRAKRDSKGNKSRATVNRANSRNRKTTKMFVTLIFAFILPYMVHVLYSIVTMVLKLDISFTQDYITRYVTSFLGCANGAVGATVLFYMSKYHRRKLCMLYYRVVS